MTDLKYPTTEAGKALLGDAYQGACQDCFGHYVINGHTRDAHGLVADIDAATIVAIEQQAAAAERARVLDEIEALPLFDKRPPQTIRLSDIRNLLADSHLGEEPASSEAKEGEAGG